MTVASPHSESLRDQVVKLLGRPEAVSIAQQDLDERAFDWWPVLAKARQQKKIDHRPDLLVMPTKDSEISSLLRWASQTGTPVTTRGLGSSVVGGPIPTKGGICLDMSRMNQVLSINTTDMLVTVEAGKNGGELEDELAKRGLTLGHSPQSLYRSTVGGWVATRATGQFSSKFGGIEHLVVGLTAVMANGEVVKFGPWPRMSVGPDLRQLMIGSEGCLAVVTQVTIKCFTLPESRQYDTVTFPSLASGLAAMREIMQSRLTPNLLRFYDVAEARHAMKEPNFPLPVMFLGSEGKTDMVEAEMKCMAEIVVRHGGVSIGPSGAQGWMNRRFDFSTIERILEQPGGVAETIEISHQWSHIENTYDALTKAMAPFATEVLGHFSHAYTEGVSLYVILLGEAPDSAAAETRLRQIWQVANQTVLQAGASLSHHHGCGMARSQHVSTSLDKAFGVWSLMKNTLDPKNILNPGKLGH